MNEISNKIKDKLIFISKDNNSRIIIVAAIITIIIFTLIGFTYGRNNPDTNSHIIQELINRMITDERTKYEEIINKKDTEIESINKQLETSMSIIQDNKKELTKLKSRINNIRIPENENEIKIRLKELGYETR